MKSYSGCVRLAAAFRTRGTGKAEWQDARAHLLLTRAMQPRDQGLK